MKKMVRKIKRVVFMPATVLSTISGVAAIGILAANKEISFGTVLVIMTLTVSGAVAAAYILHDEIEGAYTINKRNKSRSV